MRVHDTNVGLLIRKERKKWKDATDDRFIRSQSTLSYTRQIRTRYTLPFKDSYNYLQRESIDQFNPFSPHHRALSPAAASTKHVLVIHQSHMRAAVYSPNGAVSTKHFSFFLRLFFVPRTPHTITSYTHTHNASQSNMHVFASTPPPNS